MREQGTAASVEAGLAKAASAVIRRGSLSFSLAARLLGRKEREAIVLLYAWFRYSDDLVDAQHLGHGSMASPPATLAALEELRAATRAALAGDPSSGGVFAGLAYLARTYRLPERCFEEFLDGMQSDIEGIQPESFSDLKLYCYRVAGTVGLIFAHIVGVDDARALRQAAHLGIAMQLTNIARDVADDHNAGRCYIPGRWLERSGLGRADLLNPRHRDAVVRNVGRLVKVADRYYRSGGRGIGKLPFRAALAVAAARLIYAEIGRLVVKRGAASLTSRVVVSNPRKIWLLSTATAAVFLLLPARVTSPWRAAPIPRSWEYT